jgi:hypothetical protein
MEEDASITREEVRVFHPIVNNLSWFAILVSTHNHPCCRRIDDKKTKRLKTDPLQYNKRVKTKLLYVPFFTKIFI